MSVKFVFVATGAVAILALGGVLMAFLSSTTVSTNQQISQSASGWAGTFIIVAVLLVALTIVSRMRFR